MKVYCKDMHNYRNTALFIPYAGELARENEGSDFTWERDHEARMKLWKARHEILYAVLALKPGRTVCTCNYISSHNIKGSNNHAYYIQGVSSLRSLTP